MFNCKLVGCEHVFRNVHSYVQHTKLHSNVPNYQYQCGVPDCSWRCRKHTGLQIHMYRQHRSNPQTAGSTLPDTSALPTNAPLKCLVEVCAFKCSTLASLIGHLKKHISGGLETRCPFRDCDCTFTNVSSFASHICRKHRSVEDSVLNDVVLDRSIATEPLPGTSQSYSEPAEEHNEPQMPLVVDENLFFQNLTLFYLKMQSKLLLPATTIQTIIDGFQSAHELGLSNSLNILNEKLKELGIPQATISSIIEEMNREDLLSLYNRERLNTDAKRKAAFKESFNYVHPVPLLLGNDDDDKECFAQYIPMHETLVTLFKNESLREQYTMTRSQPSADAVYQDVKDGEGFQRNPVLKADPSSLGLILYQDAFEVVNPLGSGKKKHKVLAVYLTLTDILPYNRSSIDQMQLVLLCREQDFKYFGVNKVFAPLIEDLKILEQRGILTSDGNVLKGSLVAIAGDNLGSHSIGGFLENFSRSIWFCRYCEVCRDEFLANPILCGTKRTAQSYACNLQEQKTTATDSVCGIKFDSPFNQLSHFHVCQPGLPPCLGHDLFEGVIAYDLPLYIRHLVEENHFTYLQLNRCKNQFRYEGNDGKDKPADLSPSSNKLSGHAVQNWCFLRLLPLMVGDRIKDPCENEVWLIILQLREIVGLICAPVITEGQVAYLKVLIEEYIVTRTRLFPIAPLRPKHHYLCHYPSLIIHFGPLIRLWTLRFESKHTFFKQCARKLHNFRNLCKTLAERHQLLQAYLSVGNLFPPLVQAEKGTCFHVEDYNDRIRASVASCPFQLQSAVACNCVTVKGTDYRRGMYVLLQNTDDGLFMGKIMLIIVEHNLVIFVSEKHTFVKLCDTGVYCDQGVIQDKYVCIKHEDLLDYYPLSAYNVYDQSLIALHHSFPEAV
ncbi:uncharacterized protein [Nothobranchius furzeri]|uniref:uncharacterized protein isoform X1 n=1 Tax=Nothobranchius furzeri TaxID=105023 RepID=UPI002403F4CE|nr:uncharacterized protein LOC129152317 isoform X1 [Nothobranchius furzeri]XP_054585975.1 uncharacterized protein LOC129152317 isoform X1 [Nothobranchius furzeri]XP_054590492.1 uncharacterized protein LOC129154647 isoform X1 [Nothobranchius furzeri]XP_054590494.1 uncharacterized protein LOC129154647 isoform X1 [Nothobranchius furzeri]XP_054592120.1 uncharacterized protein LOC129152187 isoform X1 [Nothobranchius furzeri]XP_054592121.1 uncharacterized protein LOC129152187 isoform X1 [Nothobranch